MLIHAGRLTPILHVVRPSLLVFAVLLATSASAQTDEGPPAGLGPLSVEDAVDLALMHNPRLAAMDAQATALGHLPPQAGALPDPIVSLNALNLPVDTFSLDQEPMTQMQLAVSQSLPFPGKRKLRRSAAES